MDNATFAAPTIHCGSCAATIEEALQPLDGVDAVNVDLTDKQVLVTFDGTQIASDRIAEVISEHGYEVTRVAT